MGIWGWVAQNWFTVLSAVGIGGGLWYSGFSSHAQTKTQQLTNLITMTQSHRELWRDFHRDPSVSRVLDVGADVSSQPITAGEEDFVVIVIQHLSSVYHAILMGLTIEPDGIRRDVCEFFSLPIPNSVWNKVRPLQDDKLIQFVENCLNDLAESKTSRPLAFQQA